VYIQLKDLSFTTLFCCILLPSPLLQALPIALRKLGPSADQEVSLPWDAVREALDQMAQAAANHVEKEHFLVLWESLQVTEHFYLTTGSA
jgi:hypothetical protein